MIIAILAVLLVLFTSDAEATQEARCTELGANCVCSEPFQMTGFAFQADSYNPNDSATKQCSGESGGSLAGFVIQRSPGASAPMASSEATLLNALPSGHSVARVMRGSEGHTGIFELNHLADGSFPRNRIAVRWYDFYSTNYVWAQEGSCTNSGKWFTAYPGGGQWDTPSGRNDSPLIYSIQGTIGGTTNPDCCNWGPVGVSGGLGDRLEGKWYRIEVILTGWTNSSNFSTRFQAFRKNVTDNTAEEKVIDTFEACPTNCQTSGPNWPGGLMRMNSGTLNRMEINLFRTGGCAGFRAYSHWMVAAWNTDAGQRINAASEIEGGGGGPTPPIAPTNLRITMARLMGVLMWGVGR